MARTMRGFILAPMVVPFMLVCLMLASPDRGIDPFWYLLYEAICVAFSYGGALLIGYPTYRMLIWLRWTSLVHAIVAGFVIGIIVWLVFIVLFKISTGGAAHLTDQ